jgi:bifunctional DNA-binding transcriptional regulator/antitoxin component of YhaV-PrlF toxin-antitoxin module
MTHPFEHSLRFFGSARIAARGQVVLPILARRALKIQPGEEMAVVSYGEVLALVKTDQLEAMLNTATKRFQRRIDRLRRSLKPTN